MGTRPLTPADARGTAKLASFFTKRPSRAAQQAVLAAPSATAAEDLLAALSPVVEGPLDLPADLRMSDLDAEEAEVEVEEGVNDDDPEEEGSASSSETIEERRARTLRELLDVKQEIEGIPETWGTTSRTKKPRTRRPNRTSTEQQKTRDEYAAHKHEMKSEHPHDHVAQFAMSTRTAWVSNRGYFHTKLKRMAAGTVHILSHTWADALRADAAATACANAHNSLETKRARKRQRHSALATKRAGDLATYGDNAALERRELLRLRDHVHRVSNRRLRVLICPDGCWADALFRTTDMPPGQWLAWQHKSTEKMAIDKRRRNHYWCFQSMLGYTGALVVCSVSSEPDRMWIIHGKVLDDHGVETAWITKSKKNGMLPMTADGRTLPTNLDGLVLALEAECDKVVTKDATALPTWTVEGAEARLGQEHVVERAGVLAWMRCMHGGDQVSWLEMPEEMREDDRNLRLLCDGTVVAYPEGQQTKVDLEVLHDWANPQGSKTTYQFKTPMRMEGCASLWVKLMSCGGRDEAGVQLSTANYKLGDNDVYTIMIPDIASVLAREGHVDIWEIPEAALFERGLLGTADAPPPAGTSGFSVYTKGCGARERKHAWTRGYHMAYVHTDHGWMPGDDADEAEETHLIRLHQTRAAASE